MARPYTHLPELKTEVESISYDFKTKTGRVFMPELCCVDMSGTIRFFRRIDPAVRLILTFACEAKDTSYQRVRKNEWCAIDSAGGSCPVVPI